MPFIWAGVLLIALRGFGVDPVADWSWVGVLSPFACAVIWFEIVEPLFGLDRQADVGDGLAQARRKRIEAMFPHLRFGRRPSRRPAAANPEQ